MQPLIRVTEFLPGRDFVVGRGEFVAIFGSNDHEKSLLLRFLGLLEGELHDVYLNGQNLGGLSNSTLLKLRQKELGFFLTNLELLSAQNILENVALPLRYVGFSRTESLEKASRILESFGLKSREYFFPHQLSEVQKRRVRLARTIVNSPSLILVEDPTKNLRAKAKIVLLNDLQKILASGISIITTTNDPIFEAYATRLVKIEDDQIVFEEMTNAQKYMPPFTTAAPKAAQKKPLGAA